MALGTVALTYAPQLPGWQEGHLPTGIRSVQDYAALVVEFLDAVGIDKGILMGHSIGGWIALYVATTHPERVSRLILADPMGLDVPSAPSPDLRTMDEESFAKAVFGRLGLIATAQAYGFGAEWENVRRGPEFERQWKGRGLVASLALPSARLNVIERCGHLPMVEKPETFHRLLYNFLVGVEEEIPDVAKV